MEQSPADIHDLIKPGIEKIPAIPIRVFNLNMQYGAGADEQDSKFLQTIPRETMYKNLDNIIEKIRSRAPPLHKDRPIPYIITLQEVDFGSSRTHNIDQADYIARSLGFPYVAKAHNIVFDENSHFWKFARNYVYSRKSQWEALLNMLSTYKVDLPEEPIKLDFGLATISNYPIDHIKNVPFTRRSRIPLLDNIQMFRLKDERKSYLECRVDYAPDIHKKIPLLVVNTHLDTRNAELRKQEGRKLIKAADDHWKHMHYVLAGDLNSEPIGSAYPLGGPEADALELMIAKKSLFQCYHELHPDHQKEESEESDEDSKEYAQPDPRKYFTHASRRPRKMVDMILTSPHVTFQGYQVLRTYISDHRPVIADLLLPSDYTKKSRLDVLGNILEGK